MIKITGSNVTIMVGDMDRSISFYEKIGLTVKQRWDNHYCMMTGEGITLGIHPSHGGSTSSGTVSIGFMVPSAEEAKALLEGEGIEYKYEEDGKSGLYLHFKDPDGTIIYFVEPKW